MGPPIGFRNGPVRIQTLSLDQTPPRKQSQLLTFSLLIVSPSLSPIHTALCIMTTDSTHLIEVETLVIGAGPVSRDHVFR